MSSDNVSPINPALRHAAERGGANLPPQNKCARIVAGNRVYFSTIENALKIGATQLGIQFDELWLVDEQYMVVGSGCPDQPKMKRCGPVHFIGTGIIIETIDKPAWWIAIDNEQRAAQIIKP